MRGKLPRLKMTAQIWCLAFEGISRFPVPILRIAGEISTFRALVKFFVSAELLTYFFFFHDGSLLVLNSIL